MPGTRDIECIEAGKREAHIVRRGWRGDREGEQARKRYRDIEGEQARDIDREKEREEENTIEETRAILAAHDRSILIPTWRNEASKEALSYYSSSLLRYHLPRFLPPSASPRSRQRFPRDARAVIVAWNKIPPALDFIPLPFSRPVRPSPFYIRWLVYAEKYLPFSNNTPRLSATPDQVRDRGRGRRRVWVLIRGVILHSKFIRLSVPPPPSSPLPPTPLSPSSPFSSFSQPCSRPFFVVLFLLPPAMRRRSAGVCSINIFIPF